MRRHNLFHCPASVREMGQTNPGIDPGVRASWPSVYSLHYQPYNTSPMQISHMSSHWQYVSLPSWASPCILWYQIHLYSHSLLQWSKFKDSGKHKVSSKGYAKNVSYLQILHEKNLVVKLYVPPKTPLCVCSICQTLRSLSLPATFTNCFMDAAIDREIIMSTVLSCDETQLESE